jgi:uncharacterized membrane protein
MTDIQKDAQVETSDGHKVGVVAEVTADKAGGVEHLRVQHGDKWQVTLPASAVDRVEGEAVYLKLDKEAFDKLPAVPLAKEAKEGREQEQIELVARVFDSPDKAADALKFVEDLRNRKVLKLLNAAVLVKDEDGQISIDDVKEFEPKKGRIWGAVTGGLVGLLAGPAGVVVGALAGLGLGGLAGSKIDAGFNNEFLENLTQYLQPGSSALILLMEHHWARSAAESMGDLGGTVLQQTLTDALVADLTKAPGAEE